MLPHVACGNGALCHTIAVTPNKAGERGLMLNENIQVLRKARGLSQEELALKLNVVRQTVSKWERGISVPDAELLVALGEALDAPVSTLLGETAAEAKPEPNQNSLRELSEKLEVVNLQLAKIRESRRRVAHWLLIALAATITLVFAALVAISGSYLEWNLADPEAAVAATILHGFEWLFIRIAPLIFIVAIAGAVATKRRA